MNYILLNISDLNGENVTIAIVGILIVFTALTILYLFFRTIPKIIDLQANLRLKKKNGTIAKSATKVEISSEVNAAIAAAIYLYNNELHDDEQTVITIKKVSKSYSPWSSKLYSMRWPLR